MDKYKAWMVNLNNHTAFLYFANSSNGHVLADQIVSPQGELEHALNYFFKKYGFSRALEELPLEKERMKHIEKFLEGRSQEQRNERLITPKEHPIKHEVPLGDASSDKTPRSLNTAKISIVSRLLTPIAGIPIIEAN